LNVPPVFAELFALRRKDHRRGPAPIAVPLLDVRSRIDVHFGRNEALGEERLNRRVVVGRCLHDMAPVAPLGRAVEHHEAVLRPGARECLRPECRPRQRVARCRLRLGGRRRHRSLRHRCRIDGRRGGPSTRCPEDRRQEHCRGAKRADHGPSEYARQAATFRKGSLGELGFLRHARPPPPRQRNGRKRAPANDRYGGRSRQHRKPASYVRNEPGCALLRNSQFGRRSW
jgi:hypothetical protein